MSRRIPFVLFGVAIVVRFLAAATLGVIPRDGIVIVETARLVAGGEQGAAIRGDQHPLLPLLTGGLGGSETAAILLTCVAGGLGAVALLRIGRRVGGPACGLVAGLFGAVAPGLVRYQSVPLAEGLAIPLALWAVERALATRERLVNGAFAGLLAAAAYLARPEALLLPLVLGPGLLIARRPRAGILLVLAFAALAGPYVGLLSEEAGAFTLSRKKPVGRYLAAEEGFDTHMQEKSSRTGITRPGVKGATGELIRSLGEATTWIFLVTGFLGALILFREGRSGAGVLLILALLAADLALRFRHVHLHGYLSKRHLSFAAALLIPLAARPFVSRGRIGAVVTAALCAILVFVAVKPRDQVKRPLADAGREILAASPDGPRVATWLTPRIPYYAQGGNVKLNRRIPDVAERPTAEVRAILTETADWLALVPERLDEKTRRALETAAAGFPSREIGSGEWRVVLYEVP